MNLERPSKIFVFRPMVRDTQLLSNLEELVLKRTIHVANLPEGFRENDINTLFETFGTVSSSKVDKKPGDSTYMALVQFYDESSAQDALRCSRVHFKGSLLPVTPARTTIEVIPPTDAVFGKPMTVGRHVMAVNPSKYSHSQQNRREATMKKVRAAEARILLNIAERTGLQASDCEMKTGVPSGKGTEDRQEAEDHRLGRGCHRRERSRTPPRRVSKTEDEEEWERITRPRNRR